MLRHPKHRRLGMTRDYKKQYEWNKENKVFIGLSLSKKADGDIIEYIESEVEKGRTKQGVIKDALRETIAKKGGKRMKKARALVLAIAVFVMLCSCATVNRLGPVPVGDSGLTVEWIGDISTKERTLALTENATIKAYSAHSSDKNADIVIHFYDFPENTEEETGLTPWQFAIMMQADGTYSEFPASYERGFFDLGPEVMSLGLWDDYPF